MLLAAAGTLESFLQEYFGPGSGAQPEVTLPSRAGPQAPTGELSPCPPWDAEPAAARPAGMPVPAADPGLGGLVPMPRRDVGPRPAVTSSSAPLPGQAAFSRSGPTPPAHSTGQERRGGKGGRSGRNDALDGLMQSDRDIALDTQKAADERQDRMLQAENEGHAKDLQLRREEMQSQERLMMGLIGAIGKLAEAGSSSDRPVGQNAAAPTLTNSASAEAGPTAPNATNVADENF